MSLIRNVFALGTAAMLAVPASATVTFGTMSTATSERSMHFVEGETTSLLFSGLTGATSASAVPVNFSILVDAIPELTNVSALFIFSATLPAGAVPASGAFDLGSMSGSFSITSAAPISVRGVTGTNLLSGTFTGANIQGILDSSTGGANFCSDCTGSMLYSSDFLNFTNVTTEAFSLSLTSILSGAVNGFQQSDAESLESFRASLSGDFASDPLPGIVPEPESWAMLVVGFGLVGATVRRRRRTAVIA